MKSFAQAIDLRDDPQMIAEYRRHHERVWPEVTARLRAIGITRMRIFLRDRRLFMYFEAPDDFDPDRDFQTYAADPRAAEWDALMRTFQQRLPGAADDQWWVPMEPVFELETGAPDGPGGTP